MRSFSKLSPTEMISTFNDSLKELATLRAEYAKGTYTKAEYKSLSGKVKGEIAGELLEMGSSRKSILEDVLLRSYGVTPEDMSQIRTFGDLVDYFKPDKEPEADRDIETQVDADIDATEHEEPADEPRE